jgi:hypothetical protein
MDKRYERQRKIKKAWMFHGINEDINLFLLNYPWQNDILIFDDGLASLWKYKSTLQLIAKDNKKNTVVIAINPGIVSLADQESFIDINFIKCAKAHDKIIKEKTAKHYLNTKMIQWFYNHGIKIGYHTWNHFLYSLKGSPGDPFIAPRSFKDKFRYYIEDISKGLQWFQENLNQNINYFSYFIWPYNKELQFYRIALKSFFKNNFNKILFHGSERIDGVIFLSNK